MPADLSELLSTVERRRRDSHFVPPSAQARPWFRIQAAATKATARSAQMWIYDTIGSSFFDEGTDAKSFVRQLADLDVDQIELHLNSPGGDFFDGLAIYNGLRDHPATVTTIVDGLAASAASFIAQAGDTRVMNRAAQMMIHDAGGLVMGNLSDVEDMLDLLTKVSDSIAGIYAARGGGSVEDWRTAMKAETWYTADEAVTAGLADEAVDDEPAEPPVRNRWDLAVFNYAGRKAAPAPTLPRAAAAPAVSAARTKTPVPAGPGDPREGGAVADAAKLREALGLAATASDDEVRNALASAGLATTPAAMPDPTTNPGQPGQAKPGDPTPPGTPAPTDPATPVNLLDDQALSAAAAKNGLITIDAAQVQAFRDGMSRADALAKKLDGRDRDDAITNAIKAGKFPPSRREHYEKMWNGDPEGTRQLMDSLAAGLIPVTANGYSADAGEDAMWDAEFAGIFPPSGQGR